MRIETLESISALISSISNLTKFSMKAPEVLTPAQLLVQKFPFKPTKSQASLPKKWIIS